MVLVQAIHQKIMKNRLNDNIPTKEYFFTKKYWGVMLLLAGLGVMFLNALFCGYGLIAILVFIFGVYLITK